jgi:hypothetical protein
MGNAAPKAGTGGQIQDPRQYLGHDFPKFIYNKQIGNGKFMKAYLVRMEGVLIVAKVYIKQNDEVRHRVGPPANVFLSLHSLIFLSFVSPCRISHTTPRNFRCFGGNVIQGHIQTFCLTKYGYNQTLGSAKECPSQYTLSENTLCQTSTTVFPLDLS